MALADLVPGAGALEIADAPVRVPVLPKGIVRIVRGGEILRLIPEAGIIGVIGIIPIAAVMVVYGSVTDTVVSVFPMLTEGDDSGVLPSG